MEQQLPPQLSTFWRQEWCEEQAPQRRRLHLPLVQQPQHVGTSQGFITDDCLQKQNKSREIHKNLFSTSEMTPRKDIHISCSSTGHDALQIILHLLNQVWLHPINHPTDRHKTTEYKSAITVHRPFHNQAKLYILFHFNSIRVLQGLNGRGQLHIDVLPQDFLLTGNINPPNPFKQQHFELLPDEFMKKQVKRTKKFNCF